MVRSEKDMVGLGVLRILKDRRGRCVLDGGRLFRGEEGQVMGSKQLEEGVSSCQLQVCFKRSTNSSEESQSLRRSSDQALHPSASSRPSPSPFISILTEWTSG